MSDSSRHALYAIPEVTYGVTPTSPAFKTIRHTGATLNITKGSFESEELRSDRQITDSRHGVRAGGGEIQAELSYGSLDDLLEAVLCGTWAAKHAPYTATTISAAASDNSLNDSGAGFPMLEAGDKIAVTGFTGAGTTANTTLTVVSRTASKLVVSGATLVDDAEGESVTVTTLTNRLKAGVTRRSFSVLRDFSDTTTDRYELHTGVELNTLSLTIGVEAVVKAVFGVVGKNMAIADSAPDSSTFVAANTNAVIDGFSGELLEGGTTIATVTELTASLENGIAPRPTIGSDTPQIAASIGKSKLTGQATIYAEDASLVKKFLNQTESSLKFTLGDSAGNKIRVLLPRIKYNGGQRDASGQGPITTAAPFIAVLDSTTGSQIVIDRIPA